jgi:hypothetical protein
MDVYRAETREILRRFFFRRITHQECVAGLDAALAGVFPRLTVADLPAMQFEVDANHQRVAAEQRLRQPSLRPPLPKKFD